MAPVVLLGGVSGALWGVVGYWLASDTAAAPVAWIALAASPLIGVVIGLIADRARPRNLAYASGIASINMMFGVFLFGLVLGLTPKPVIVTPTMPFTPTGSVTAEDPCKQPSAATRVQCAPSRQSAVSIAAEGVVAFVLSGFALLLFPLALLNHYLIWSRPDRRRPT